MKNLVVSKEKPNGEFFLEGRELDNAVRRKWSVTSSVAGFVKERKSSVATPVRQRAPSPGSNVNESKAKESSTKMSFGKWLKSAKYDMPQERKREPDGAETSGWYPDSD